MRFIVTACLAVALAAPAMASITVDGTLDASYGAPYAVQTVETGFGDEDGSDNNGDGVGSEMNAAYAKVWNGRLYLMLTGNIQPNFGKLEILIDSKPGGENTISGTPQYDFGSSSQNMAGWTLDAGVEVDYHLFARAGDAGNGRQFDVDFIDRAGGVSASVAGNSKSAPLSGVLGTAAGTITPADLPGYVSGAALSQNLDFAFDNSNLAGVFGGTAAADPVAAAAVTTGLELSIALADLGNPAIGDVLQVVVAQNNDNHNYLSNQVLGGLPAGTGNLGGDGSGGFIGNLGGINFNQIAGNQFFRVPVTAEIPEPSSVAIALGALAAVGVCLRRK